MGFVKDTFFGGAEKKAGQAEARALEEGREILQENVKEAQRVSGELIPRGQEAQRLGSQAALDVFSRGLPQQLGAFQQGGLQAQQTTAAALPQIQNAILGQPVDFSGFQPQQVDIDPNLFSNLQLPQFPRQEAEILAQQQAQQPQPQKPLPFGLQFPSGLQGQSGGLLSNIRRSF